ncbi:TPA: DNA cytosine methyltransferase [Streptococcus pneumoniae]|uniref:Cytosine-specific methyltransferase n=2 Tax=root TaxID=1 RepID=Q94M66_9CAUD|nr:DNA cytosine methyltransferase [Streptococcus pneumoniae]NP_150145.1 DNA methyltransferase [Streptococcus phage MM1]AAZ82425.1 C5 methyltransferase alpha subunit [Streptococcus phage MM1 1998]AVD75469.1 DNA (cytosine-5-)-methyltransferase [Streptococcus pneumoniae]MBW4994979.1 DNA cytosine methyltransferase [Streptococcus pneumoniae]MBW5066052.1 DNA cytosine methyltransferase [Streptococcus pneumoniae]MBW8120989.1 DNA cytosine methyltransferase [Streptococcus pneumoniae]
MKFLDLFAGIGGFRIGMESAGHECIGFCEIDKFARASYKAIHDTKGEIELHDITTVSDDTIRGIGHVDVICGGFPCQAFSIAGNRRGFEDTRGTLFFEIARFASILKPRYLFLENVKGLLNHDRGNTFEVILSALDELGYDVEWQVLNSKNFGVPQNRERVFIIGHLRGGSGRKVFPLSGDGAAITCEQPKINKVGNTRKKGKSQSGDVVSIDSLAPTLCSTTTQKDPLKVLIENEIKQFGVLQPNYNQSGVVYEIDGISPTIRAYQGGNLEPKIRVKEATKQGYQEAEIGDSVNLSHPNSKTRRGRVGKQIANTLLTGESQGVVEPDFRIRKLTPRECWRLQGFPDWAFDKAQEVNSNSQLYKQAGNSVTVNVISAIAQGLGGN